MANQEYLAILKQGVDVWNKWRVEVWDELARIYSMLDYLDFKGAGA